MECRLTKCFLGRMLEITSGDVCLGVTLDVGPRIIKIAGKKGENIAFEDKGDAVNKDVSAIYGEGKQWHIYGGHRMWLSPEDESTYYPDNTRVDYVMTDSGAIFEPGEWKVKNVRPRLELKFDGKNGVEVEMSFVNTSSKAQKLCIWALTVLKCGGKLTVPLSTENTGYLANRNLVHWHYNDVNDERFALYNDKFVLTSTPDAKGPFKIGTMLKGIKAVYEYNGTVFTKKCAQRDGEYPDFTCNLETYTSELIHEVETLSPMEEIAPGGKIVHTEKWRIE